MTPQLTLDPDRKDELLTTLADARRRAVLAYLRDSPDDVATVGTLTDDIDEAAHGGKELTAVRLVHSDLPRLDEAGLVEFDEKSLTVRYAAAPDVEQMLTVIAEL